MESYKGVPAQLTAVADRPPGLFVLISRFFQRIGYWYTSYILAKPVERSMRIPEGTGLARG